MKNKASKDLKVGKCITCGRVFNSSLTFQKYCSPGCRRKNELFYKNRKEVKKRCPFCGLEYITFKANQLYCSDQCYKQSVVARNKERYTILIKTSRIPSLKLRFEVFQRDDFKCQYCGRSIKDGVILQVDHVVAKANGGKDEKSNLVTACSDCNNGKSDCLLKANNSEG